MIYNFNLGIGWASSGVEYAQSYRAAMLRRLGAPARFIFTDMFPQENIEHMTRNIGFTDEEVLWLYTFFTDFKVAPVSYTLQQLEASFDSADFTVSREGKTVRYVFGDNRFYTAYLVDEQKDLVHRVELVSNGFLIRKDYFTYGRVYSEYYAPKDNRAHLYQRRFFNEDGSLAYEELNDDEEVLYRFPDRLICSKEELVGYMVERLHPTEEDIILIDRTTGIGQSILMHAGKARVGVVIHADHFSESGTDEDNILWNNYYEYPFAMHRHIDFYIASTDEQNRLVREQFEKYMGVTPKVYTVPVGGLEELKYPGRDGRRRYSVITASRLASEKHIDWLVQAVVEARKTVPQLTLDIYGQGGEEEKLRALIREHHADRYIRLMGQYDLREVYQQYELYLSGSTSEGFGLTLMEAVGGGLPIIGFDVRYGNPTFIDDGQNGYLIPVNDRMDTQERVQALAEKLVLLFTRANLRAFHAHSYEVAKRYLAEEVERQWKELIG